MGRLDARVVATTRAGDPEDSLVRLLEEEGAKVLVWPTLTLDGPADPGPLRRAARALDDYDWVVFTSARAVPALAALSSLPGDGTRVAAVGEATASAVERAGWRVDLTGGGEGAQTLVEAMAASATLEGSRVLFPAGSLARVVVEEELGALGARVDRVEAYRTRQTPPDANGVRADLRRGVDVVTFASPSAVHSLAEALDGDLRGALQGVPVAAIGRTTADALVELGIADVETSTGGGMAGLVEACVSALLPASERTRG